MIATDFRRNDCQLGKRKQRITYNKLKREYRCNECGNRLNLRWDEEMPENWHIACSGCGSHDFIHERELQRQKAEALEVTADLPDDLAEMLGVIRRPPELISLAMTDVEI
jgi:DNA-directed RNA polymerase subunit RPC12/RpoP